MIRVLVIKTHRDNKGCERVQGSAYLVDEEKARELAALEVLAPVFEAADPADEDLVAAVAALAAELFPAPQEP